MKKSILLLLLFFITFSVSASSWAINTELGVPSTVGVTYSTGNFDTEIKFHTTFGLGGILANSFLDKVSDAALTTSEKFSYGNKLLSGLSLGAFYKVIASNKVAFLAGVDATFLHASSKEGVISHFTTGDLGLFNINLKLNFNLTAHNNIFIKTGFPLFAYLNYGGEKNNTNYCGFDFWAFLPTAMVAAEEGNYVDIEAKTLALIFAAIDFKLGYSYSF